jgi:PhoH-like ATPase
MTKKRQYLLDTNILISDPSAPYQFDEHDIVITMTLLEELDHIKDSSSIKHDMARREARTAIQTIKKIINGASPEEIQLGVSIAPNAGKLRIINDLNHDTGDKLSSDVPDNRFIKAVLYLQKSEKDTDTVFVTKDFNLELKARAAGVRRVEDYFKEYQIDDIAYLAKGYHVLSVDLMEKMQRVECVRDGGFIYYIVPRDLLNGDADAIYENLYLFNEKSNHIYRVNGFDDSSVTLKYYTRQGLMNINVFGVKPRSLLQALAMDALIDPLVNLVELTGPAGSGKTLLALAAGLHQSRAGDLKSHVFDKIIVTRNLVDMGEEIGFLPGTEEEKVSPWMAAFADSLEVLFKVDTAGNTDDKLGAQESQSFTTSMVTQRANLQFKSMNFMRGRSFNSTYFILDEAQNTTPHQMKSMITRMGEGSKMVVLGNLGQVDAKYLTPLTSGLTHAVEKMKDYVGGATLSLPGGERSALSAYAEEHL